MSSIIYDCIIVGGGPSGATAAYHLSKRGHSVLLLEKEALPRYKPCGGGVAPVVAQWFDFDLTPTISWKVTKMRCTWCMENPIESEFEKPHSIWMVRREIFDNYLVEQAKKQGVEVKDQTRVEDLEWQSNLWCVKTEKGPFLGRFVIAADGAKGITAKKLGFAQRKCSIAGAIEVEAPLVEQQDGVLHLEFGLLRKGYLWNFPKVDGHSVGIGALKGDAPKGMREILSKYCDEFSIRLQGLEQHGHPLLLWDGHQVLHTNHAVLAGEAACVVDPLTGEGIRPSIYSGMQAALAVHKALGGDFDALKEYTQTMQATHGKEMAWAHRLAVLLYTFSKPIYDLTSKKPSIVRLVGQIMNGQVKYEELAKQVTQRFWFS